MAPNDMAPNDMAPNDMAPNDMAPNDMAPNDMAPNDMAPNDSDELLVAEATDAFLELVQAGADPKVDVFAAQYPRIASVLKDLLPAMLAVGGAASRAARGGDHRGFARTERLHLGGDRAASFGGDDSSDVIRSPGEGRAGDSWPRDGLGVSGPAFAGQLGDFRLIREVGRGGMGVVYEAQQVSLGRRVALKVLPLAAALDSRQLQRFRMEAQAAAHLHHSNIVPIYSVGCERGVYYYAMQFIQGRSLAEVISGLEERHRAQPPGARAADGKAPGAGGSPDAAAADAAAAAPERTSRTARETTTLLAGEAATLQSIHSRGFFRSVAALGMQAAEALEYAHGMGVVHRDIKPANLLVGDEATVFVADFGLAQLQGDSRLTFTGDLVGTLRYMSPEQTLRGADWSIIGRIFIHWGPRSTNS